MDTAIDKIRTEFRRLCALADLRATIHFSPQHDGSAHVEVHGAEYSYVVTERGSEFERRRTTDREELLYWLIAGAVFDAACEFEVRNRVEGRDFRRTLFAKKIELMAAIQPEWASRQRAEIERVLEAHPYDDGLG
jgi:hypothetical protein